MVTSSLFGDQSKSTRLAGEFVQAWRRAHPGTTVVERTLTAWPWHLSLGAIGGDDAAGTSSARPSPSLIA